MSNSKVSSSVWVVKISKRLKKKHTVYTMDLSGAAYLTNGDWVIPTYMYVLARSLLLSHIIKLKTSVVVSNSSSSFVNYGKSTDASHQLTNDLLTVSPFHDAMPDQQATSNIINLLLVGTFWPVICSWTRRVDRQICLLSITADPADSFKTKYASLVKQPMTTVWKILYSSLR